MAFRGVIDFNGVIASTSHYTVQFLHGNVIIWDNEILDCPHRLGFSFSFEKVVGGRHLKASVTRFGEIFAGFAKTRVGDRSIETAKSSGHTE